MGNHCRILNTNSEHRRFPVYCVESTSLGSKGNWVGVKGVRDDGDPEITGRGEKWWNSR